MEVAFNRKGKLLMELTSLATIYPENYNSKILVEMWGDFIDWEKRRKGENGFLTGQLKRFNCKIVFDACLGDGADSIYLIKEGLQVTSNDIDKLFIKKAKKHAREAVVKKIKRFLDKFEVQSIEHANQLLKKFQKQYNDMPLKLKISYTQSSVQ